MTESTQRSKVTFLFNTRLRVKYTLGLLKSFIFCRNESPRRQFLISSDLSQQSLQTKKWKPFVVDHREYSHWCPKHIVRTQTRYLSLQHLPTGTFLWSVEVKRRDINNGDDGVIPEDPSPPYRSGSKGLPRPGGLSVIFRLRHPSREKGLIHNLLVIK